MSAKHNLEVTGPRYTFPSRANGIIAWRSAVGAVLIFCSSCDSLLGFRKASTSSDSAVTREGILDSSWNGIGPEDTPSHDGVGQNFVDASCTGVCAADHICHNGACVCPSTQTDCGGTCTSTLTDAASCGHCGARCPAGQFCANGACASTCPSNLATCGSSCVDEQNDPQHCGACTGVCAADHICHNGACVCPSTQTECTGTCVGTQFDVNNCGGCGTLCAAGQFCANSACVSTCPTNLATCGTSCVDEQNDPQHCGACAGVCAADHICHSGACTCPSSQRECGGKCVSTSTDAVNCGDCGNRCAAGQFCANNACVSTCPTNLATCGTSCVDEQNDPQHCGACAGVCAADHICHDGACTCPSSQRECGGKCVSTSTDPVNCGDCGNRCAADQFCANSACVNTCPNNLTACGSSCTDSANDPTNCGACGNTCSFPNAASVCVGGTCQLGPCLSGYGNPDGLPSNGCECQITNGGKNICDGIDHACNGLADYNIVNGIPVSTCQCIDHILSLSSYSSQCGQSVSCIMPQCPITNGGNDIGMSYTLGECISPYPWAQCMFNSVSLNAFDADHGAEGILEISLTISGTLPGQTLNGLGFYYGNYPGRKRFSFFTAQESKQGVTPGSYTKYFRPSDAVCQINEPHIPASCTSECANGQWVASDGPDCLFSFDRVPLWVTAEFCNGTAVTASLQNIEIHYLTGPVCTCQVDADCRDPTRPVCDLGSLVCVPGS